MLRAFATTVFILAMMMMQASAADVYLPFVKFNGGVVDSTKNCTTTEWSLVRDELARAMAPIPQRQLRRNLVVIKCDGKFTSYVPRCASGRSSRKQKTSSTSSSGSKTKSKQPQRQLQVNGTSDAEEDLGPCNSSIVTMNTVLDSLVPKLSPTCAAYVASTREYVCRQPLDCNILGFALWNGDTDTIAIARLNATGTKICTSLPTNFEVQSHFDLGDVNIQLKNATQTIYRRRELQAPYFSFANRGADVFVRKLGVGSYTLTAVSDLAPNSGKTVQFDVVNC